ncbi:MAG: NHLP bacteriocin system secretion protein [Kiritimatiellia bacterium]
MAEEPLRKSSLTKLSSPEELDKLIQITTPKGWMWMAGLGLAVLGALVWAFTGSLSDKVTGQGIIIRSGGVYDVIAGSSGRVKDIYFGPGDEVQRGQTIARIEQVELANRLRLAKERLNEEISNRQRVAETADLQIKMEEESFKQQGEINLTTIRDMMEKTAWLKKRLQGEKKLLKDGLVTSMEVEQTRQLIAETERGISMVSNRIAQAGIDLSKAREAGLLNIKNADDAVVRAEQDVETIQRNLDDASRVISRYSGTIVSVDIDEGMMVSPSTPVAKIELSGRDISTMEVAMFIPARDGKKVGLGMMAEVSPSTVKKEEFGYMPAIVTYVSSFPATEEDMFTLLHNESLVRSLSSQGVPIQINATLIPDARQRSGFKWSSPKGPDTKILTGTICDCSVSVAEHRPIDLVIPMFKKKVLGIGAQTAE